MAQARKRASAPKRRTAQARKPATKAVRARKGPKSKAQPRARAARPTCPICGSRDVEVRRPEAKSKAAAKLDAGVVAPIFVDRHAGLACHSCGYREEAVA
jgi:DNA-directed RNA polymerase subunit M/transcription elongation factor TFIIS